MSEVEILMQQSQGIRLLYVEDNAEARESIRLILEEFFSDIVIAVDGMDGLEKFRDNEIDLIITDLNMPRMNGLEMIEKIREMNRKVAILIFSAYTESEYFVNAIKLSVDGYLLKPFDMEQFLSAMGNVLAKIRLIEAQHEVEHQHRYLQAVVDGIQDPIMVINEAYTIELMNESLRQKFDSEIVADPAHPKCYEVSHHRTTPCDTTEHRCPLKEVMETHEHIKVVHEHIDPVRGKRNVEIISSPLYDYEGECVGIIESARDITEHLDIQSQLLEQKKTLAYQAYYDALTRLPNRLLFDDRISQLIERARRHNELFALFFIDLDKFKIINDSLGHRIGDEVLRIVAQRLQNTIRSEDTIARLGGDEFTILMEELKDFEDASVLAQKLLGVLVEPIIIDKHELYISASIGISFYPRDDTNKDNLLKYADTAMYKAKENGCNTFRFYSSEMTTVALEYIEMAADLHHALENEEFLVYYQPQFNDRYDKLTGIEVFVRWSHPEHGLIYPSSFLHIAEETGMIISLDLWIMRRSMEQMVAWRSEGLEPGVLTLNLTMMQMHKADFIPKLKVLLAETGMRPEWLELEVKERHVMVDSDDVIHILKAIRELGVKLAIDDFGTGYLSLARLKRLPVDRLKIDRSLIQNVGEDTERAAVIEAVIALSRSLSLDVLAEGVETTEQKIYLLEKGCQDMQGYLYGKPMPADPMRILLKAQQKGEDAVSNC